MTCDSCGKSPEHGDTFLTHRLVLWKKTYTWSMCSSCEIAELRGVLLTASVTELDTDV